MLALATFLASSPAGCGGETASPGSTDKVYVDLNEWNGKPITALDAGKPRFIVRGPNQSTPTRRGLRGPADQPPKPPQPVGTDDNERGVLPDAPTGSMSASGEDITDPGRAAADAASMPLPKDDPSFALQTNDTPDIDTWAIPLTTASGEMHANDIRTKAESIASTYPALRSGLWVHSTDRGSKVLYGRYAGVDDPDAQRDLKMIKSLKDGSGKPAFSYSFLSHIESTGTTHPFDIRSLRKQFPKVKPLYTIDVATWIAPDDSDQSWKDTRRRAESYCGQLRAQGYEAYFYHNNVAHISSVTVGKFDRTAYNSASGLTSLAVRDLMQKFPMRLTNGEPLMVPVNPRDPNSAVEAQAPIIVEVPDSF